MTNFQLGVYRLSEPDPQNTRALRLSGQIVKRFQAMLPMGTTTLVSYSLSTSVAPPSVVLQKQTLPTLPDPADDIAWLVAHHMVPTNSST